MPRVPVYPGQTVEQQPLAAPSSSIDFGPGAYGAQLSEASGAFAKTLFKQAIEKAQFEATSDAAEAVNVFQRGMKDIQLNYMSLQLKEADGVTARAIADRSKLAKDVQKNIRTDHGARIFERMLSESMAADIGPVQGHETEQAMQYRDRSLNMVLKGEFDRAVVANKPVDPTSLSTIEANVAATTRALYAGKLDDDQVKQKVAEKVSEFHMGNLARISDPLLAQAYYKANGGKIISTEASAKFEEALTTSARKYQAHVLAVQAAEMARHGSDVEARDWLTKQLPGEENLPTLDAAYQQLDYLTSSYQQAVAEDQKQFVIAAWKQFFLQNETTAGFTPAQVAMLGAQFVQFENIEASNLARDKAKREETGELTPEELAGLSELYKINGEWLNNPDMFENPDVLLKSMQRAGKYGKKVLEWAVGGQKPTSLLVIDNKGAMAAVRKAAFDAKLITKPGGGTLDNKEQQKLNELIAAVDARMPNWSVENKGKKPLASDFEAEAKVALQKVTVPSGWMLIPDKEDYAFRHPEIATRTPEQIEYQDRFLPTFEKLYRDKNKGAAPTALQSQAAYLEWVRRGRPDYRVISPAQRADEAIKDQMYGKDR